MDWKKLTFVLLFFGLTACSAFERHSNSGYGYDSTQHEAPTSFYKDKKKFEVDQTKVELGLDQKIQLSEREVSDLRARLALKRLENKLYSANEKQQYYGYKPLMRNDIERIEFLKLPTMSARERWAQNRNLVARKDNFSPSTLNAIEKNDIAVGMNQQAVKESWGDPDGVDIAGNELYGNQAWRYTKMISSDEGYKKEVRVIYFESGRVVGWESF